MDKIHPFISETSLQTYQIYDIMCINATFWPVPRYMYMHQADIVVDHCTKYKLNQPIVLRHITVNMYNWWQKNHNYSNVAQRQMGCYNASSINIVLRVWYLINVPNMNKLNQCFTEISHIWHNGVELKELNVLYRFSLQYFRFFKS